MRFTDALYMQSLYINYCAFVRVQCIIQLMKLFNSKTDTLSIVLLYIILILVIVETYINANQNSLAIRGLAIAMILLAGIVVRRQK